MRHLALILWIAALIMEGMNIGFCARQMLHPFAFPRWRRAWLYALLVHAIIIYRRGRLLYATVWSKGMIPLAFGDVTEQLIPFGVSFLLLLFNWHIAFIFLRMLGTRAHE